MAGSSMTAVASDGSRCGLTRLTGSTPRKRASWRHCWRARRTRSNNHNSGNTAIFRGALALLATFVDRLGRYEPAATIVGFGVNPLVTASNPEITAMIARLRDVLGVQTYESLARKGETMTTGPSVPLPSRTANSQDLYRLVCAPIRVFQTRPYSGRRNHLRGSQHDVHPVRSSMCSKVLRRCCAFVTVMRTSANLRERNCRGERIEQASSAVLTARTQGGRGGTGGRWAGARALAPLGAALAVPEGLG